MSDSSVEESVSDSVGGEPTSLDLSFKGLYEVPRSLGNVSHLEVLDLSANQISHLPPELFGVAGENENIGSTVVGFPRLRRLCLANNLIQELPHSIGLLSSLEQLDLSSNRLRSLPDALLNCTSLKELRVRFNHLSKLPDGLGLALVLLQHLDVSYNELVALPDSLGCLKHLERLCARFNRLHRIPFSLGDASSLNCLDLSANFVDLTSVPGSLGNLGNLVHLDLSYNQIEELPVQLGRLQGLQTLGLEGNPLRFPPRELIVQPAVGVAEGPETSDMVSVNIDAGERKGEPSEEERVALAAGVRVGTEVERRDTCRLVLEFLGKKLQEWEEQERARVESSLAWKAWVGDWPMLEWFSAVLVGPAPVQPALEGLSAAASEPGVQLALQPMAANALELEDAVEVSLLPGETGRS